MRHRKLPSPLSERSHIKTVTREDLMLDRPDFSAHFGTGKAISRPEKLNSSLRGLDLGIKGERVGG